MSADGCFAAVGLSSLGLLGAECMPQYRREFGLGCETVERRFPTSGTFYRGSPHASPFLRDTVLSIGTPEDGESIFLPPD
jgi:hypothetical protein